MLVYDVVDFFNYGLVEVHVRCGARRVVMILWAILSILTFGLASSYLSTILFLP